MMLCPFCAKEKTIVVDSIWDVDHKTIRRRRHCLACSYRWTTLEVDEDQINNLMDSKEAEARRRDHPME